RYLPLQPAGTAGAGNLGAGRRRFAGRFSPSAASARRTRVLPQCSPDAAVPRALLHFPDTASGGAGLCPRLDWCVVGAGGGRRDSAVFADGPAAGAFSPEAAADGQLCPGGIALAAARLVGGGSAGAAVGPAAARCHFRMLPC